MDFLAGLPLTSTKIDAIWVIVDHLTKSLHFLVVRPIYTLQKPTKLCIVEIVSLLGMRVSITSYRDPQFT